MERLSIFIIGFISFLSYYAKAQRRWFLFHAETQRRGFVARKGMRGLFLEVVYYSVDAVFDQGFIEIDEKSQFHIG